MNKNTQTEVGVIRAYTTKEHGYWQDTALKCYVSEQELLKRCKEYGWHSVKLSDGREFDVVNLFRPDTIRNEQNTPNPNL